VFTLRSYDDADSVIAACEQASRIAIIGASFIGIEAAFSLSRSNLDVTVIAPESVPFEQTLGKELGTLVRNVHEKNDITFKLGRTPEKFEGTESVRTVLLDNGERIEADVVIVGIGVMPMVPPLQGLALQPDGSVRVDSVLRATETVYAAGDIATFADVRTGKDIRIEHWRTAEQQGRVAAHNMAGKHTVYDSVPFFWTKQGDLNIKYVGHAREWDEIIIHGDIAAQDCLVLYVKQNQVLAVAGINRGQQLGIIQELLRLNKMPDAGKIRQGEVDWQRLLSS
jgi:NADPH-dependent 2,4-dienoyl-CoA reductase/sulfur reductase-like enzyme